MKSSQTGENKDPLVHVATTPNEVVAGMWKDILEQNDIRVLITRKPRNYLNYGIPSADDLCQIHVLASKAGEARQILESLAEGENQEPDERAE